VGGFYFHTNFGSCYWVNYHVNGDPLYRHTSPLLLQEGNGYSPSEGVNVGTMVGVGVIVGSWLAVERLVGVMVGMVVEVFINTGVCVGRKMAVGVLVGIWVAKNMDGFVALNATGARVFRDFLMRMVLR
jgi:hypothetical protein